LDVVNGSMSIPKGLVLWLCQGGAFYMIIKSALDSWR
jgi:hypothetical protein